MDSLPNTPLLWSEDGTPMLNVQTPIPGADELIAWVGKWPSFHDAEVLSVHLERRGTSHLRIHTWQMTNEVDSQGYYILTNHVIVTFHLQGISTLDLEGFSGQNVISGLSLEQKDNAYELTLWPCYGIEGKLTAASIQITLEPGLPLDR